MYHSLALLQPWVQELQAAVVVLIAVRKRRGVLLSRLLVGLLHLLLLGRHQLLLQHLRRRLFVLAVALRLDDEVVEQLLEVVEALDPLGLALLGELLALLLSEDDGWRLDFLLLGAGDDVIDVWVFSHGISLLLLLTFDGELVYPALVVGHLLGLEVGGVEGEDSLEVDAVDFPPLEGLEVDSAHPDVLRIVVSPPYHLLDFLFAHASSELRKVLLVEVLESVGEGIVGGCEEKDDFGVLNLFFVVLGHSFGVGFDFPEVRDDVLHVLEGEDVLDCPLDADAVDRAVVVRPREDGRLQPAHVAQLQVLLQEDAVNVLGRPPAQVHVVAVPVLGQLQHHPQPVGDQVGVLSDCEVGEAEVDQLGDLAVGLVGRDHELDAPGVERAHGGGDDAFVDDDAAREVLPGLLLVADAQVVQPALAVLLLVALALLERVLLLAHVAAVKHAERTDAVVVQQVQHLEDVVEEVVGLDVLVELVGAPVAPLVQPGHDVHRRSPPLETADVLTHRHLLQEFQQPVDTHWRQLNNIKYNQIAPFIFRFRLIPIPSNAQLFRLPPNNPKYQQSNNATHQSQQPHLNSYLLRFAIHFPYFGEADGGSE